MNAQEIRGHGIASPAFTGGGQPGAERAVAENIGICAGALIEIAAQLAELNERINAFSSRDGSSIDVRMVAGL